MNYSNVTSTDTDIATRNENDIVFLLPPTHSPGDSSEVWKNTSCVTNKENGNIEIVLGKKELCDTTLVSNDRVWHCTKNWIDTNFSKPDVIPTLSQGDSAFLNTIIRSIWPIYKVTLLSHKNLLDLLRVAILCGVEHFIEYAIVYVNRDHLSHYLNNPPTTTTKGVTDVYAFLDAHKSNKHIQKQLTKLIHDSYTRQYTINENEGDSRYSKNDQNLKVHFLFDSIDLSCLSPETMIIIVKHLNDCYASLKCPSHPSHS